MYHFSLLALASGSLLPLQLITFGVLAKSFAPVGAMVISTCASFLASVMLYFFIKQPFPDSQAIQAVPFWAWFGGVISSFYVYSASVAGPKLGTATYFTFLILGQYSVAFMIDHFGLMGFPQHPINLWRITGAILLISGVLLIVKN